MARDELSDSHVFIKGDNFSCSYKEFFDLSDSLFSRENKDVVLIFCERDIYTILAYIGALRAGLVPLLVDSSLDMHAANYLILKYCPKYSVGRDIREHPEYQLAHNEFIPNIWERKRIKKQYFDKELALLLPTSGSTGDPKSVRLSYKNLDTCTKAICHYLDMTPERTCITSLPFQYSYGLSVLNIVMESRASLVITNRSVLERAFWDAFVENGVTDFSGVPFTFESLKRFKFSNKILSTLRYVTQAGGRQSETLTDFYFSFFSQNNVKYFTMYGQTEASPRISYLDPAIAPQKRGSVGIAISCGSVEVIDPNPVSGIGELRYKGPNVCMGYADSREDLSEGDVFNGVLDTGDVGWIDDDGCIFITGRKKRFVKVKGVSINLDHVEKVLKEYHPEIAVVGIDDKLCIVCAQIDGNEIKEIFSSRFQLHPSTLKFETTTAIPLMASGKTDYQELVRRYLL